MLYRPWILLTLFLLPAITDGHPANAYNSEEHKLITDRGVASVRFPASTELPDTVYLKTKTPSQYQSLFKNAKLLGAGFSTNNPADYDPKKKKVQDNYYYRSFGQLKYNKSLWIPPLSLAPGNILYIKTKVGKGSMPMTIGELSALYGDYRKMVAFSKSGRCFITNESTPMINFARGNFENKSYAPESISAGRYLRFIGSGLVPPFGSMGNATSNTANDDEYSEAGWWGDEMMRIANVNDWHFSNTAVAWYVGMHRLAILYAKKAAKEDKKYWNKALNYEASALHSLVDLFAFGHVVTNRAQSSYAINKRNDNLSKIPCAWMENVITMGGGKRDTEGRVLLDVNLPSIKNAPTGRVDFTKTSPGVSWGSWANAERKLHDRFNNSGAIVRNLRGDKFQIYGDAKIRTTPVKSREIMSAAVRASVQSLVNAYSTFKTGKISTTEYTKPGSKAFEALTYLPVYIESDPDDYFKGRWTLYAGFLDKMTGSNKLKTDWEKCRIPYLNGGSKTPVKQAKSAAPSKKRKTTPSSACGPRRWVRCV